MGAMQQVMLGAGDAGSAVPFSSVALQLHMDGSNGSTTFTDSSSYARTGTAQSAAAITTAQSVFGGACGNFTDAGSSARVEFGPSASLRLIGNCCIEFRLRMTSVATGIYVISADASGFSFWITTTATGQLGYSLNGTARNNVCTIAANTWYAIRLDVLGTSGKFFLDGVNTDTGTISALNAANNLTWSIGSAQVGVVIAAGQGGRCYIDEFRLTIGASRSQSNYTVDIAPFPDS